MTAFERKSECCVSQKAICSEISNTKNNFRLQIFLLDNVDAAQFLIGNVSNLIFARQKFQNSRPVRNISESMILPSHSR